MHSKSDFSNLILYFVDDLFLDFIYIINLLNH